jgi:hypothetical protein
VMWELYFSFVTVGSLLLAILFTIISRFTIYRHACKLLRNHRLGSIYKCSIFGFVGTLSLVQACTFPNQIKDPIFNGELKVSRYATRSEKIIAYITMYSWLVFMLCIVIYYIAVLLGVMEW